MTEILKSILDAFHDLLFIFTKEGVISDYIATNHEDELIIPKEAFIGHHHRDVLPAHISSEIDKAFKKLEQDHNQYKFDYDLEINGEKQWYTAVLSKMENGDESRYLGAVRNITERKKQELLLRGILNTSPGGIMVCKAIRETDDTTTDFEITQANRSVETLTGAVVNELVGLKITSIVARDFRESILNYFKNVAETGNPVVFQYQHRNEQGKVIWFHIKVVKYRDGVISTFMDITDQKETEDKLANKNRQLKELNRQKDKLFSVISHDLKNAVGGSKGVYDLIFEDFESLSKNEIYDYLKLLKQSSNQTHELLEDLLAWSRNQFQEVSANLESIRLASLADSVLQLVGSNASDKKIVLKNEVPETLSVMADSDMAKSILRNLVSNGVKFTESGGEVIVKADKKGNKVEVSIIDNGVGIDKASLKKIFNKESNYTTAGTDGEKGSGLGLDLCVDFVDIHNGKIWVESEPGKGSKFTFTLPVG